MSIALHQTAVHWDGTAGIAKHDGVTIELTQWPAAALPGAHVREVHYVPGIRECEIRLSGQGWRPMLDPERAAVRAWLEHVAEAAHGGMDD